MKCILKCSKNIDERLISAIRDAFKQSHFHIMQIDSLHNSVVLFWKGLDSDLLYSDVLKQFEDLVKTRCPDASFTIGLDDGDDVMTEIKLQVWAVRFKENRDLAPNVFRRLKAIRSIARVETDGNTLVIMVHGYPDMNNIMSIVGEGFHVSDVYMSRTVQRFSFRKWTEPDIND